MIDDKRLTEINNSCIDASLKLMHELNGLAAKATSNAAEHVAFIMTTISLMTHRSIKISCLFSDHSYFDLQEHHINNIRMFDKKDNE